MADIATRDSNRIPVLLAADSVLQKATQVYVDPNTHRLLVDAAISIDNLTVSQNIAQVGGAAISLGQALMAASLPVVIASNQTAIPVSGTFYQATQPVSIASLPALPAGTNVIGHVIVDSGAITVNTISGFALETGGNLATLAGTVSSSKINVNISSGSIGNTSFASTIADGADVTLGSKTDTADAHTDGTSISIMSVLKEISAKVQSPASTPVTGTFWQATQPVSLASLPALSSGTNIIGKVSQDTSPWVISGDVTEATLDAAIVSQEATTLGVKGLTVFGAVTTNAPSYTTLKSDALSLDTSGLLRVSLKDTPANTNKFLVTADAITIASSQTLATVTTVTTVTTVSNLSQIASTTPTFGDVNNATAIAGALNDAPVGRYNATLPTLTDTRYNLLQVGKRGGLHTNIMNIDGTVGATVASLTNANPLAVEIVDGSGNQITSFGGGTQYTDAGTPPAHPIGNALVFDNGSSAWQAVNSAHGFPVNVLNTTIAVTQSGTWTDRIVGNAGASLDSTVGAGTAPTNQIVVGALYNSTEISPTTGQAFALQADSKGRLRQVIMDAAGNTRGANVTSANELTVLPTKKDTYGTTTTFTITLASLANSTAGVGRQSTMITGNTAQSALIAVKFTVGTTPTLNSLIYVYLLRGDGTINDDNAGSSDAGLTVINAPLLGTILVSATTSNVTYYGVFDTKFLGSLGASFGIALVNSSGVTANGTGGNFSAEYTLIT